MSYWLFKSEPGAYSIDALRAHPGFGETPDRYPAQPPSKRPKPSKKLLATVGKSGNSDMTKNRAARAALGPPGASSELRMA